MISKQKFIYLALTFKIIKFQISLSIYDLLAAGIT
jgi:hypothetical protein